MSSFTTVLFLSAVIGHLSLSASGAKEDHSCYVSSAGCKYRVTVHPTGHCPGMAGDDPNVDSIGLGNPESDDLAASVKKMENLEQTLIRMMEGLSTRSLRHIRQIKADLRQMSQTMNQLKAKTSVATVAASGGAGGAGGKKSNGALLCPTEFVGGGTWPSCYRFSQFNASWYEAREYCSAFGANLLSLDTIKEAYIIDYLLKSNPEYGEPLGWWTSGNYIVRSQKWMWTSKQQLKPIGYSRWAPGEPNARSTMHCLILGKSDKYFWQDATCTDKYSFVCEIDLV